MARLSVLAAALLIGCTGTSGHGLDAGHDARAPLDAGADTPDAGCWVARGCDLEGTRIDGVVTIDGTDVRVDHVLVRSVGGFTSSHTVLFVAGDVCPDDGSAVLAMRLPEEDVPASGTIEVLVATDTGLVATTIDVEEWTVPELGVPGGRFSAHVAVDVPGRHADLDVDVVCCGSSSSL